MADLRRVIEIDVKTSAQALNTMREMARNAEAMEKRFDALTTGARAFGSALAGALSVGAVIQSIRATADAFDEMGKRAERVGTTTEALSALTYQAKLADVQAEQLDQAMVKLSGNLADMGANTSQGAKALHALGVTETKDTAKALEQISEKFAQMENGAKKTALAVDIFGKSGAQLIPMLNEGADGMKRAADEAEALGQIVREDAARAAQQFNDNMTRLGATLTGIRNRELTPFINALAELTDKFFGAGTAALSFADRAKLAFSGSINMGRFVELKKQLDDLEEQRARIESGGSLMGRMGVGADQQRRKIEERIAATKAEMDELNRLIALRDRVNQQQAAAAATRKGGFDPEAAERAAAAAKAAADAEKAAAKAAEERRRAFVAMGAEAEKAAKEISDAFARFDAMTPEGRVEAINKQLAELNRLVEEEGYNAERAAVAREKLTDQLLEEGNARDKLTLELKREAEQAAYLEERRDALNDALYEGTISIDAYIKKIAELDKAQSGTAEETDKTKDKFLELGEAIQRSVEGWSGKVADAIVDFAHGTTTSVSKMVTDVLGQFERMALQILILDPIFKAFGETLKGMSAGGFGSIFAAEGAAFGHGGNVLPFARGGVVSRPTLFKFAGGTGVMGEAGPEAIMPLKRSASGALGVEGGAAGVQVNVINNAGADVKVEQGRDAATGQQVISVMVERAVQDAFARGRFDSLMSSTYGVSRQGR